MYLVERWLITQSQYMTRSILMGMIVISFLQMNRHQTVLFAYDINHKFFIETKNNGIFGISISALMLSVKHSNLIVSALVIVLLCAK